MYEFYKYFVKIFFVFFSCYTFCANQTTTLSPIFLNNKPPFTVTIEVLDFVLPVGTHSGAIAVFQDKWLIIGGRINGLHGFEDNDNNFPKDQQNTSIYVIDFTNQIVSSRALNDAMSGLTQAEIDTLSVTSPQYYKKGNTLYITGGYGFDTALNTFNTKDTLSAIDVPSLINWVINPSPGQIAKDSIRQIADPAFKVTGGFMTQIGNNPTLLVFGQNFEGAYRDSSNGVYTMQVRRFEIIDDGVNLNVNVLAPSDTQSYYRRRDLNVVPIIRRVNSQNAFSLIAFAGVFTPDDDPGYWTVPVEITADGTPSMADPNLTETFKQGMNIYISSTLELFSESTNVINSILFGGITFEYFSNGRFLTDSEFPFTNQVTTINIDNQGKYKQFFLNTTYPLIKSQNSNPGNTLLFGSGAYFIKANDSYFYENGVLNFDKINIGESIVAGYIVGGIQSTLPNTNTITDSVASPYIFKVTIERCSTNVDTLTQYIRDKYL